MLLITFISFKSLMVLSINISLSHSVLFGLRMIALEGLHFNVPPLDEFKGKNEVSTVSLPLLFAVTLSIITSNIYTRLAACNCISITFWSGDLPSPLMAIFTNVSVCSELNLISKSTCCYTEATEKPNLIVKADVFVRKAKLPDFLKVPYSC